VAVGCFKEILADRESAKKLLADWIRELPAEARGVALSDRGCLNSKNDPVAFAACAGRLLRDPNSELFQAARKEGGNIDVIRERLALWSTRLHLMGASSLACDRLQGNVEPSASGKGGYVWKRPDPGCGPGFSEVSLSGVDYEPTSVNLTEAVLLADQVLEAGGHFDQKKSDADKPRSVVDPVVDLSFHGVGYTSRKCPRYLNDMGCVPETGPWAPGRSEDGSTQNVNKAFPGLREVLFADLGQHAIELLGQSYVSSLMVLNSSELAKVGAKKGEFFKAASCLTPDARARLEKAFSPTDTREFSRRAVIHRTRLGRDLLETAKKVIRAESQAREMEKQFQNDGSCGFIADRYQDSAARAGCQALFADWKAAEHLRDAGFANYPVFSEDLRGKRVLERLAEVSSASEALKIHDQVLGRVTDATLSRVGELCEDPVKGGKLAVFNPVIARSYLEQHPDAGWVFCSAYAELEQNQDLKAVAKGTFLASSLLITGGWSGLVFAGISGALTIHDIASRHEAALRDREEYLAGVGNVAAYLEAREALDSFYWDAAVDLGLEGLGLVPELGMLRSWGKAERLARMGKLAGMGAEVQAKLAKWYRGRLGGFFGDAVKGLSEAQVRALARLEESGLDLEKLKGAACSL